MVFFSASFPSADSFLDFCARVLMVNSAYSAAGNRHASITCPQEPYNFLQRHFGFILKLLKQVILDVGNEQRRIGFGQYLVGQAFFKKAG